MLPDESPPFRFFPTLTGLPRIKEERNFLGDVNTPHEGEHDWAIDKPKLCNNPTLYDKMCYPCRLTPCDAETLADE